MGRWRRGAVLAALVAAVVCAPARADIPGALTLSGPLSDEHAVALDDHGRLEPVVQSHRPARSVADLDGEQHVPQFLQVARDHFRRAVMNL